VTAILSSPPAAADHGYILMYQRVQQRGQMARQASQQQQQRREPLG
jgi:hypothetical protein